MLTREEKDRNRKKRKIKKDIARLKESRIKHIAIIKEEILKANEEGNFALRNSKAIYLYEFCSKREWGFIPKRIKSLFWVQKTPTITKSGYI